jgi:hypothetical protein
MLRLNPRSAPRVLCALVAAGIIVASSLDLALADSGTTAGEAAVPTDSPSYDDFAEPVLAGYPPGLGWWAIDTAVITSVTWGLTLALNENIREGVVNSSGAQWLENISQAPEWHDGSDTVTNYVAHPLLGATWFLAYRSRGHNLLVSSLSVVLQAVILEYGIEGPHNVPSAHDLVFTPLIGIPIGFGLDTLSIYLLKKQDRRLRGLGYLFNPFHLLPSSKKRLNFALDPVNKRIAFSGTW